MKFYPVFKPNPPKYAMVEAESLEEATRKIHHILYSREWLHHHGMWTAAGCQVCAITKDSVDRLDIWLRF